MLIRVRVALTVLVGLLAALLLALALSAPGREEPAAPDSRPRLEGFLLPPGVRAAPFALVDQDGRRATLADYRGRVVVLTFMYSRCRDTCPLMAQQIRGALDQLPRPVPVLALSVDPAGDTAASARRFVARNHLTGRLRFLLGSRRELAPLWKRYGVQPHEGEGRLDHTAHVLVVDRHGFERVGFPADQLTPETLAHDIRALVAERA